MYKIIVSHYSRGNVGNRHFDNDKLREVANVIKNRLAEFIQNHKPSELSQDLIERWLEDIELWDGVKVNYDENKYQVIVSDRNISRGCSWGYDEITLTIAHDRCEGLREFAEKLPAQATWKVSALDPGEFLLQRDALPFKEGDIISGEELKQFVLDFIESVRGQDENLPFGPVNETPICSQDPYAWGADDWSWTATNDKIEIGTKYTMLLGAHYHLFKEKIIFTQRTNIIRR